LDMQYQELEEALVQINVSLIPEGRGKSINQEIDVGIERFTATLLSVISVLRLDTLPMQVVGENVQGEPRFVIDYPRVRSQGVLERSMYAILPVSGGRVVTEQLPVMPGAPYDEEWPASRQNPLGNTPRPWHPQQDSRNADISSHRNTVAPTIYLNTAAVDDHGHGQEQGIVGINNSAYLEHTGIDLLPPRAPPP